MKKEINILLILLSVFLLSSCFTSTTDVDNAKQELLWETESPVEIIEEDKFDTPNDEDVVVEERRQSRLVQVKAVCQLSTTTVN